MKVDDALIGKTLFIGVIISSILVLGGGLGYLQKNGVHLLDEMHFKVQPQQITLHGCIKDLTSFEPLAYVMLGVILLFVTQLVRVAMTAVMFLHNKESILFAISSFVFISLLISIMLNL